MKFNLWLLNNSLLYTLIYRNVQHCAVACSSSTFLMIRVSVGNSVWTHLRMKIIFLLSDLNFSIISQWPVISGIEKNTAFTPLCWKKSVDSIHVLSAVWAKSSNRLIWFRVEYHQLWCRNSNVDWKVGICTFYATNDIMPEPVVNNNFVFFDHDYFILRCGNAAARLLLEYL